MHRMIWIGAGLILILGGVWWYVGGRSAEKPTTETSTTTSATTPTVSSGGGEEQTASAAGQYLTYTGDLGIGSGRRLLFFHAPWCPQCRALETSIQAEGVPEGVTIIKVDYDSNQDLRQRYGVTIQTTLVELDASHELIERYVAYDEPSIAAVSAHFDLK